MLVLRKADFAYASPRLFSQPRRAASSIAEALSQDQPRRAHYKSRRGTPSPHHYRQRHSCKMGKRRNEDAQISKAEYARREAKPTQGGGAFPRADAATLSPTAPRVPLLVARFAAAGARGLRDAHRVAEQVLQCVRGDRPHEYTERSDRRRRERLCTVRGTARSEIFAKKDGGPVFWFRATAGNSRIPRPWKMKTTPSSPNLGS